MTRLSELLSKTKTKSVVIGGISVGLIGRPRFTADIDAVILLDFNEIEAFIKMASKFGFAPRIKDVSTFARKSHVLLFTHEESGINVDLSIGLLPFEHEMVERSRRVKIKSLSFNIPTPEDLIIMKAVSHRPKDLIDIEHIADANPRLDMKRIGRWVKEFAHVLEMPELWSDVEKILSKRGKA